MNPRRLVLIGLAAMSALPCAFAQVKPELLRIGFQKSASLLALQKTQGTLEKRLAPLGVQLKWVEFPAGPQLLEGLDTFHARGLIPKPIRITDALPGVVTAQSK